MVNKCFKSRATRKEITVSSENGM